MPKCRAGLVTSHVAVTSSLANEQPQMPSQTEEQRARRENSQRSLHSSQVDRAFTIEKGFEAPLVLELRTKEGSESRRRGACCLASDSTNLLDIESST